jgi:hypothetical protein
MSFTPALPTRFRPWSCALLLMLVGVAGCETQRLSAPENAAPVPSDLQNVAQVEFEVNPESGAVTLRRFGSDRTGEELWGLAVPVTAEHLQAAAQCEGCNDRILDNQTITVRFTVKHFVLEGVDFRRNGGNAIDAMTCANCTVRSAELRSGETRSLPDELVPGAVFEAVLRVDAVQLRPFAVRFDLLASAVAVPTRFIQLDGGSGHSCALRADGTAACWGSNDWGESKPPAGSFAQVSAGGGYSCGLRPDGTITCWGLNSFDRASPPPGTYTYVSAGGIHGCAVRADATLACWGDNDWGQLEGIPAGTFTQVSAGIYHSCAIRTDGTLACWGWDFWGQANPPAGTFVQVSVKDEHSCGVRTDASLACWGNNVTGQTDAPAGTFLQVTAGEKHSCAIRTDVSLACWGHDLDGQATPPAGTFTYVSAGDFHTCTVRTNGLLTCWGRNWEGESRPPLR